MQTGDRVVLKTDPLRNGYGTLQHILNDGRVTVQWESGDIRPHHPQDLELAATWENRVHGNLADTVLNRLARG